jgi:triacylglycerol lipase
MSAWVDRCLAILNGAVGDSLASAESRLAMTSGFFADSKLMKMAQIEPAAAVVIFVHGLMGTERDWVAKPPPPVSEAAESDARRSVSFGPLLAHDFGFAPLYFRYNTGRQIDVSGEQLAATMEQLYTHQHLSLRRIVLIGHSMGGRVVRSALNLAYKEKQPWAALVSNIAYLGSPLRGSPLEVAGERATDWLQQHPWPTVRQIGGLADLRSRGIKDLGRARSGARSSSFRDVQDARTAESCLERTVDSLDRVGSEQMPRQLFVAGKLWRHWMFDGIGDSLVPVKSALDYGGDATAQRVVIDGILHVRMTTDERLYDHLSAWLRAAA